MTTILVTGPTILYLRDIALPRILKRIGNRLYTFTKSPGIPKMCSSIECDGDTYIFLSYEHGREKFQGLLIDKWIAFEEAPVDIKKDVESRLHSNNTQFIRWDEEKKDYI